jgi:hypothetical protein
MSPPVIVDDFHIVGIAGTPTEADAPLIVDPDTVLTGPVAFQRFQPIAGRNTQKVEAGRSIHL